MTYWIRRAAPLLSVTFISLSGGTALAQDGFSDFQLVREGGNNIDPQNVNPSRDLVLVPRALYAFSGLSFNLSDESYFQPITLPLGAGYGLIDNLEVGADFDLLMNRPEGLSTFAIRSPRLYGRYAAVPQILAVEGSIFIPVFKDRDGLGLRLEAPFRYAITPDLLVMGAATWAAYIGASAQPADDFAHWFQLGGNAIYRFVPKVWAAVELGLTVREFEFDHARVPLGFAAGFEVMPGIAILPGFRFPDIGHPESRVLQVLAVYQFEFQGARQAEGESDTPDIPLETPPIQEEKK